MFHIPVSQVQRTLKSNSDTGLSSSEVAGRRKQFGPNAIAHEKDEGLVIIFVRQFKSPIILLLFIAAAISFFFNEWIDAIAILIVLLINAIVGFFMEYQAQRSMKSLHDLTRTYAKVIRDGVFQEIQAEDFVPGDILYVEAGDVVVADARIYNPANLQTVESALTGESVPVEKSDIVLQADVPLAERVNMIYKGTYVTRGNTRAIVCNTGMQTELGKIAAMVQRATEGATPIERKLGVFSRRLIWITAVIVVVIFTAGIPGGRDVFEMLRTAIAMAVAAIPEGLPIVATLALAYGMIKMARKNVIVKKLAAVETLGGTTIICTDKTGTLTLNSIRVDKVLTPDGESTGPGTTMSYDLVLKSAVLCNTAHLTDNGGEVGDPLETGLLKFAADKSIDIAALRTQFRTVKELPFTSETKIMASLHETGDGAVIFAKGAAEELIARCSRYLYGDEPKEFLSGEKSRWTNRADELASSGLKVIAFAYREAEGLEKELASDLVFTGLAGLIDPPRKEVPDAIRECRSAGIRVVMVTGDHPSTAKNIALQLGIIGPADADVLHGSEMKNYDDLTREEKERWKNIQVFARVSPRQKLDLISVYQEEGNIIAMTGDGVNDAPALKKADIGIAMGKRGTAVAQEVADMVLKDDSFSSIVVAIKEGRVIFENIRKFLMYLLSSNLSEIIVVATVFVAGFSFQLFPLQILFINLISDVFPALALGAGQGSQDIMKRPPRDPKSPVMSNKQWISVMIYAVIIAGFTLASALLSGAGNDVRHVNNILFYTLILSQLLHVFNMGDRHVIFYKSEVFKNKFVWAGVTLSLALSVLAYFIRPVRDVLHLQPVAIDSLAVILGFSLASFVIIQTLKRLNLIL